MGHCGEPPKLHSLEMFAYMVAENAEPFPDSPPLNMFLDPLGINPWDNVVEMFRPADHSFRRSEPMPDDLKASYFQCFHSVTASAKGVASLGPMLEMRHEMGRTISLIPLAILNIISAGVQFAGDALFPTDPLEAPDDLYGRGMSTTMPESVVLSTSLIIAACSQQTIHPWTFGTRVVKDFSTTGAIVNGCLVPVGLLWSLWHLHQLTKRPADSKRSAAVLTETSNLASYLSCTSHTATVVDENQPASRQAAIASDR